MGVTTDTKDSFTNSAIGDLKIFEVQQDGKYVRLLNDGVQVSAVFLFLVFI